ncbi:MAG TPA: type IV secretory system conjugative DNA transfer family protein [Phenylobacterium sp.]
MGFGWRIAAACGGGVAGLFAATQYVAWQFHWATAFGPALRLTPDYAVYPPWSFLLWRQVFGDQHPEVWSAGVGLILLGLAAGSALASLSNTAKPKDKRARGWGGLKEARKAGLLAGEGCVLGELEGRLLTTTDLRPTLVTGGTRSGKGRGHVVPSLLGWTGSALVHDPKGELWRETSGWRATFSHALYFNPRDPHSARLNVLTEIQPGPQEVAQVQRLVAILADPGGVRDDEAIWDKAASEILEALILHVLYTAADDEKSLPTVARLLADLDRTCETMLKTLHRLGPDGEPQTHPFIEKAVRGYCAMHDRFRTSVQGTARSYLKWIAGDDVERALSTSDFAIGDLMCAEAPMSLYVQVAPADQQALKPLVRLFFYAASQSLTVYEDRDAAGRPKRHKLLMAMDEFPLLGRLAFFEKSLRLMSGYGLKTMFAAQSLNDIVETYGVHNTILDNCHVYTAFSALDPLTQEKVSRLTGTVAETRTSVSQPTGLSTGRSSTSRSTVDRPLLEPGEVRSLPDEEQLTFVAGHKPLRTRKVRYDELEPFRSRATIAPPDQSSRIDAPTARPHPWKGRRALGLDPKKQLDLFPEQKAMMSERESREAAQIWREEQDATDAALDDLRSRG